MSSTQHSQLQGAVDAELFLSLSAGLKDTHQRLSRARVSPERRRRWQRRLIAITKAAVQDLVEGNEQLSRFTAELDRELGVSARARN